MQDHPIFLDRFSMTQWLVATAYVHDNLCTVVWEQLGVGCSKEHCIAAVYCVLVHALVDNRYAICKAVAIARAPVLAHAICTEMWNHR